MMSDKYMVAGRSTVIVALVVASVARCDFDASSPQIEAAGSAAYPIDVRRVWRGTEANFYAASPSPDGRFMTAIDWGTGDLALRNLETGELQHVTSKGTWADNSDYAEYSVFSPDGQRIAYSWFREAAGYQLRVIDRDGSNDRVLVPQADDIASIVTEDWSPNGDLVLATILGTDRSSRLVTVSVVTGEVRTVRSDDRRHPEVAAFSRDGEWIAFDLPHEEDDSRRDIFVIGVDGGAEQRVVDGSNGNKLLGWLPDGSGVLFHSDREGMRAIWQQSVRAGRASGQPVLVRSDVWQLIPVGFSKEAYFYGINVEMPQVHTALLDESLSRVVVRPEPVQPETEESSRFGAWSADGNYFAFLRIHLDRSEGLVIRSVNGTESREIALAVHEASQVQWHPDGRAVYVDGTDDLGRRGIHRVDVQTGSSSPAVLEDEVGSADLERARLMPDGTSVLYVRLGATGERGFPRQGAIVRRDLATGAEQSLHSVSVHGHPFVSPDGEWYAKLDWSAETDVQSLRIGRTDGSGDPRTIYETDQELLVNRGGFPFTPDGQYILAAEYQRGEPVSLLRKIPVDGGPAITLLEWPGNMYDLRLSRDGRHVSFGSGQEIGEFWMMEFPAGDSATVSSGGDGG